MQTKRQYQQDFRVVWGCSVFCQKCILVWNFDGIADGMRMSGSTKRYVPHTMKKVKVIKSHKSNYPHPISFKSGDVLSVGERDMEFEGWVRVTTSDGNEGWAPEQYLEYMNHKWVAIKNYNAKELDILTGQELVVIYELNEWVWVKNSDEIYGWVPAKTVSE